MSKLSSDALRDGISSILAASQEKQRNFTETIELQVSTFFHCPHSLPNNAHVISALQMNLELLVGAFVRLRVIGERLLQYQGCRLGLESCMIAICNHTNTMVISRLC